MYRRPIINNANPYTNPIQSVVDDWRALTDIDARLIINIYFNYNKLNIPRPNKVLRNIKYSVIISYLNSAPININPNSIKNIGINTLKKSYTFKIVFIKFSKLATPTNINKPLIF